MDFIVVLFYGALAGLSAGALSGFFAPYFIAQSEALWRDRKLAHELAAIAVHLAAGIVLALLFWLSWGLAAIVGVPWWQRGGAFALLTWTALVLPILAIQALCMRVGWRWFVNFAFDGLLTCTLVGLACAWSWSGGR